VPKVLKQQGNLLVEGSTDRLRGALITLGHALRARDSRLGVPALQGFARQS
jgi:hypothetical protein